VPRGAPEVPPVPPGFDPVGTASLNKPAPRNHRAPLLVAGGFAGALAALFAQGSHSIAAPAEPAEEIAFLDSVPPPGSHLSLSAGSQLLLRLRLRLGRGLEGGLVRLILLRNATPNAPCGVIEAPLARLVANSTSAVSVSGPLLQGQVCRTDRLRVQIVDNGTVVASTNESDPRDFPASYFIDP